MFEKIESMMLGVEVVLYQVAWVLMQILGWYVAWALLLAFLGLSVATAVTLVLVLGIYAR